MSARLNLFAVISFLFLTVACSEDNTTVEPEQTTYSLTLITEGGGAAESEKSAYPAGEAVLVTAIPNEDFTFSAWYEEENRLSGVAAYSFSMPERDLTLRAVFLAIVPEPEPDVPTEGTLDMSQTIASEILGRQQNYTITCRRVIRLTLTKNTPFSISCMDLGRITDRGKPTAT